MSHFFPLAIITDEVSQELPKVVSFAKEFKLNGIEVRSLFGKAFKDFSKSDVREIGLQLGDAGLKVVGCAAPVFKCDIDKPTEIEEHIEIFKRSVEKAVAWNCDMVRVFTFLRRSTPSTGVDIQRAASYFPRLIEAVKGTNIRIGIENEYTTIVGSGSELQEFLKLVPSPLVGGVWDPCNVLYIPGMKNPVVDDFPLIADRVFHFHVKDAKRENGQVAKSCVEVGKGEVDFPLQLAELKKRGYKGWVSLETHWRSVSLGEEITHLPAGYAFSMNAEPASRICMANLIGMMSKL